MDFSSIFIVSFLSADIGSIISGIDISSSLESFITAIGGQMSTIIPIGIIFIFLMSLPRVLKRIIRTFI